MAKRIRSEEIELSIVINGNKAQKEILELEKANQRLINSNKELTAESKKFRTAKQKESQEYRELTNQIKLNSRQLTENKTKINELTASLKVSEMTMSQLQARASVLRNSLNHMLDGVSRNKVKAELEKVTGRMSELNTRVNQSSASWGKAADWLNRYQTLALSVTAAVTGVVWSLQKFLDISGKLDDQLANVRKTTGLTKQEVEEFAKSLSSIDTRTSKMNLLKIAEEGGRLNIPKEELLDFVKVMDKSAVALGDSFKGGVEEIASNLGKIKGLFEETKNLSIASAYESIGSAINDLGAAGIATEENIADFTQRLGTLPNVLKPTVAETMALGAAFEESGLKAEISATNTAKLLQIAARDYPAFAKVMKMSAEDVKQLINNNPTEFLLKFGESLKGLDATQLSSVMKSLGLADQQVVQVVGALSQNTDKFREKIELANKSMLEATSLTNEFNIKNETLAAYLEKIQKTITGWMASDTFIQWLGNAVKWFAIFIGAVEDADGSVAKLRNTLSFVIKLLAVATASIISYRAAILIAAISTNKLTEGTILYNTVQKLKTYWERLSAVGTAALAVVQNLFGNAVQRTTTLMVLQNAVMKANPWALALSAIAAIVVAIKVFNEEQEKTITHQDKFNKTLEEYNSAMSKDLALLDLYYKKATNANIPLKERKMAVDTLQKQFPQYFSKINDEIILNGKAADSYLKLRNSIIAAARADAIKSHLANSSKEILIHENKIRELKEKLDKLPSNKGDTYMGLSINDKLRSDLDFAIKTHQGVINMINNQNEFYIKKSEELGVSPLDNENSNTKNNLNQPFQKSYGTEDREKEELKRRIEELRNLNISSEEELYNLKYEYAMANLELQEDTYDKEIAILDLQHQKKTHSLQVEIDTNSILLTQLNKERTKATKAGQTERVQLLDTLILNTEAKEAQLTASKLQAETELQLKKNTIIAKYQQKELDDSVKHQESMLNALTIAQNEELSSLKTFEEAKKLLKEKYQLPEEELENIKTFEEAKNAIKLQQEKEFAQKQIENLKTQLENLQNIGIAEELNNAIGKGIYTEEEEKTLLERIEKLKVELSELISKQKELKGKGNNDSQGTEGLADYGINGGTTDILGMNPEQWTKLFDNIKEGKLQLSEVVAIANVLKNAFSTYYQFIEQAEQRQLQKYEQSSERKKTALKRQLDNGYISQETYNTEVQKLEDKLNKQKAEMEYKQAKRQRQMAIVNTIMNTAQGIMGVWAKPGFPSAIPLTALVGAMGAVQLAMINKQPLPAKGYEKGLYGMVVQRQQDGQLFDADYGGNIQSGLVYKPTYYKTKTAGILVGENSTPSMPELVVDRRAYAQFSPNLKNALHYEIARVKGYEYGFYRNTLANNYSEQRNSKSNSSTTSDVDTLKIMYETKKSIDNLNVFLEILIKNGVVVDKNDFRSMRNIKEGIEEYNKIRNSSKI